MDPHLTLLPDLALIAALSGAALALGAAVVLFRRLEGMQRRHRAEMENLVRSLQRLEHNDSTLNRNLGVVLQAGQRIAAEMERAHVSGARTLTSTRPAGVAGTSSPQDDNIPPPPLPRTLH